MKTRAKTKTPIANRLGSCFFRSVVQKLRSLYGRRSKLPVHALADLLAPHREVKPLLLDQIVVRARFDEASSLKDEDPVGVQHRGEPVGDENGDQILPHRDVA